MITRLSDAYTYFSNAGCTLLATVCVLASRAVAPDKCWCIEAGMRSATKLEQQVACLLPEGVTNRRPV
jgi:hypothetical protein